jgi:1,2-diacylglycerol 3-beta-galactosyltransferase
MTAPPRERRVLFLIADTGAGHRSAANAIHHAMRLLDESQVRSLQQAPASAGDSAQSGTRQVLHQNAWRAEIVDAFVKCSRFPLRNGVFLYGPAIKHSPRLYGQFFRITNSAGRFQAAWRLARPLMYQGIVRLLLETQPDVVVSVHPLVNHITLQVLHDLDVRIPFVTVVTDLVNVHIAWIAPGVTACVVPTEAARRMAISAGLPPKRVYALGMPVDPRFAQAPVVSRGALRQELGLDTDMPTVLLIGGGEGAIGLAGAVTAVAESDLPVQMVVITGRNHQLFAHLRQARDAFAVPAQILGFVDNMPDLMHAADVVVTKAGPGTITEAMASGLPIVLTGAVPGQEEGNVDFVVGNDLGTLARSPDEVVAALREILAPGNQRLEQLRTNVLRMSRPEASFDIARLILRLLPDPSAPSPWTRLQGKMVRPGYRPRRTSRVHIGHHSRGLGRRSIGRSRRAAGGYVGRAWLRRWGRRGDGRPRRLRGLANLKGARALLLRGTYFGKVQLRRPGRSRRRDDAGPALGNSGDSTSAG